MLPDSSSFEDTVKNLLKMPHKPHKPAKADDKRDQSEDNAQQPKKGGK